MFHFLHRILRTRKSLGEGEEWYQRHPMALTRSLWVQGLVLFSLKMYLKVNLLRIHVTLCFVACILEKEQGLQSKQ